MIKRVIFHPYPNFNGGLSKPRSPINMQMIYVAKCKYPDLS